jgi:prevent-host-death family protein
LGIDDNEALRYIARSLYKLVLITLAGGDEMADTAPTTETMKISDVRSGLNKLVNRVYRQETRVIVEKSGIPVAGIVSARDLERLKRLDEENREAWEVLEAMRTPFRDVPSEEIEREAKRTISEVRAEMRAERERPAATS